MNGSRANPVKGRRPFDDPDVEAVFDAYPVILREHLLGLRDLIYQTAAETEAAGRIVECLKWGQPAYLTEKPKSGSTIRIGAIKDDAVRYGLFFHCQSRLVPMFREYYGDVLSFEGNRAIVLSGDLPVEPIKHCVGLALTYQLNKGRA